MPLEQNPLTGELFLRLPPPHTDIIITPARLAPQPYPYPAEQDKSKSSEADQHGHNHDHDGDGNEDDDETIITTALNDPRVYPFLESPPFPYRRENAVDYVWKVDAECRQILSSPELQRQIQRQLQIQRERQDQGDHAQGQDPCEGGQAASSFADGCPFRFIRKVVVPATTSSTSTGKSDDGVKEPTKEVLIGDIILRRYPFYEIPPDRSEERDRAREKNEALPAGHPDLIWGVGCMYPPLFPDSFLSTE